MPLGRGGGSRRRTDPAVDGNTSQRNPKGERRPVLDAPCELGVTALNGFSLKCRTTVGFIVSTSTAARSNRSAITAKMRRTSASDRYMVSPSMMTSAGASRSSTAGPQSSMADMAICETVPSSGISLFRTAIASGRSRLYQWAYPLMRQHRVSSPRMISSVFGSRMTPRPGFPWLWHKRSAAWSPVRRKARFFTHRTMPPCRFGCAARSKRPRRPGQRPGYGTLLVSED